MTGDCHVGFCERREVRFLPATHLMRPRNLPERDSSEGHHPAHRRPVVSIRVYQSDGLPIYFVPGHGRALIRPLPKQHGEEASQPPPKVKAN